MTQTTLLRTLALIGTLLMGGCSAISAISGAASPLAVYELRAPVAGLIASRGRSSRNLVVELPGASGALNTDRIMIRPSALQAEYLPEARWADPTPEMLQTLILRSLENTQALRYVGRKPLGPGGDVALLSEVTDFQAELSGSTGARINLRIIARIVREEDTRVIATRIFTASAEIASTDTAAIVEGFDIATAALLTELTGWTMATLQIGLRSPAS